MKDENHMEKRIDHDDMVFIGQQNGPWAHGGIDQAIAWIEARMNEIGHLALRLWMGTRRGAASLCVVLVLTACGADDYVQPDALRFVANSVRVATRIAYALITCRSSRDTFGEDWRIYKGVARSPCSNTGDIQGERSPCSYEIFSRPH